MIMAFQTYDKEYLDTELEKKLQQVEELPTASADELGKIYQYVGETTTTYIKGIYIVAF